MHGEARPLIKLHIDERQVKLAIDERDATTPPLEEQSEQQLPATSSAVEPAVTQSPSSALHPTVASYSRDDVLAAEPDTLRALADEGLPFAQHFLGVLLMTGSGGQPLDRTLAAHYLRLSLQHEQTHVEPLSAFFLAGLVEQHPQSQLSQQSPLSLYRQYCNTSEASSPFHYEAMFRAARLMLQADSARDEERSEGDEWMERAARGGHAEAMLHVAQQRLKSASNRDGTNSEQEAREWMQRARTTLEQQLQGEARSGGVGPLPSSASATASSRTERRPAARMPSASKRRR